MDDKAQVSMEILLIAAAVIAVAVVLITSMKSTASSADSKIDSGTKEAISNIGKIK